MPKESAKQFIGLIEQDAELQTELQEHGSNQIVSLAKEKGFDFSCDELEEVIKEIRNERKQGIVALDLEDMDKVVGGQVWFGEKDSDGYEFGCLLAYHHYDYQKEKNLWCKSTYYCADPLITPGKTKKVK